MRISLFVLMALGVSTVPAFAAGARIHRLYHAPIQQERVIQNVYTPPPAPTVTPTPGKKIPMLPTSRPLPPQQNTSASVPTTYVTVLNRPRARYSVPIAPTTPVSPVSAATRTEPSPVAVQPVSRPVVTQPVTPVTVEPATRPATISVPSPAPAPKPAPKVTTKSAPRPVVAPVAAPEPQPVTPAVPKQRRRLPIAPIN